MNILFLRSYFPPEEISSPYISSNLFEEYASRGWNMMVMTPSPSRNISEETRREYKNRKNETSYGGRMQIRRFPLFAESKKTARQFLRYLCQNCIEFWKTLSCKEARHSDVLIITSTPPTQGAMAALIKKFTGVPVVYMLQDIFPDSLVGTGLAKKEGFLWKIGRKIENFTYRNVDKIIVIGESFKRNLLEKGVPEEKIEVVYNWADEALFGYIPSSENPLFEKFGVDRDDFNVVYAGNLGNAQNIDVILDTAKLLSGNSKVKFYIFGSGANEDRLKDRISQENIDNVKIFPLQPIEDASKVYNLGNVCIVSCKEGLGGAALPSKTLAIMASGRPIVASFDSGELTDLLENNRCGISVPPNNAESLADKLSLLAESPVLCEEMGKNGLHLSKEKFGRTQGTHRYAEIIDSVAKNRKI